MKKSHSLFICFALFLLSLVLCCKPIKAAEPTVINLSELNEGEKLEIKEDSVLNLDTDKSLFYIGINGHELTISGNGTLELRGVKLFDSGKMILNSGTIKYSSSVAGDINLEVNGGSIILPENIGIYYKNITINGGYISGHHISTHFDSDSSIRINGGHLELKDYIDSPNLYIDDNMFVVEPWNKAPEQLRYPLDNSLYMEIRAEMHGVKLIPKSEVKFLSGISFSENSFTLNQYEHKQLAVNFFPENASNKNITWSSSDSAVALVHPDGFVSAFKPGSAVITATSEDGAFTASCEITVSDPGSPDGLVIEVSSLGNTQPNQTDINVTYKGYKLKAGIDFVIKIENDENTGLSTTKIIGLDECVHNIDKIR